MCVTSPALCRAAIACVCGAKGGQEGGKMGAGGKVNNRGAGGVVMCVSTPALRRAAIACVWGGKGGEEREGMESEVLEGQSVGTGSRCSDSGDVGH